MNRRIAIEAQELSFGYAHETVLTNISFSIGAGELVALIGPNGSGKTTLLRILLGHLRPGAGQVLLANRRLQTYARKQLAKTVAYVSQQTGLIFPLTAFELVSLGRFPHGSRFIFSKEDTSAVARALEATNPCTKRAKRHDIDGGNSRGLDRASLGTVRGIFCWMSQRFNWIFTISADSVCLKRQCADTRQRF